MSTLRSDFRQIPGNLWPLPSSAANAPPPNPIRHLPRYCSAICIIPPPTHSWTGIYPLFSLGLAPNTQVAPPEDPEGHRHRHNWNGGCWKHPWQGQGSPADTTTAETGPYRHKTDPSALRQQSGQIAVVTTLQLSGCFRSLVGSQGGNYSCSDSTVGSRAYFSAHITAIGTFVDGPSMCGDALHLAAAISRFLVLTQTRTHTLRTAHLEVTTGHSHTHRHTEAHNFPSQTIAY